MNSPRLASCSRTIRIQGTPEARLLAWSISDPWRLIEPLVSAGWRAAVRTMKGKIHVELRGM